MAVGCGAGCAKCLLIVINLLFLLSGIALIAVGSWLLADEEAAEMIDFITVDDSTLFRNAAILLITMGAFVLIVAIIGFAGAATEKTVVLSIYIGLLVVIFIGEIAAGIVAIVYKDKLLDEIDDTLMESLHGTSSWSSPYYIRDNTTCKASSVGALWDLVQIKFHCCGVNNGIESGYETSNVTLARICPELGLTGNRPLTCCSHAEDLEPIDSDDQVKEKSKFNCNRIVTRGCSDALAEWVEDYAPVLIGIGIGIGMFELMVIIFAVCLCQNVVNKDEDF